MTNHYYLNGIKISVLPKSEGVNNILSFVSSEKSKLLITFNLDNLRISCQHELFKKTCIAADLVVPDGAGVIKILNIKYGIQAERITGNDILEALIKHKERNNLRYAFVGASEKVLNKIKIRLSIDHPKILNTFFYSPPLFFENIHEENQKLIQALITFKPDILLVALGCPRQELWLFKYMNEIGAKINIGLGAAFDFYSREKQRAPLFFQKIGIEWLWRLGTEPYRLGKRYVLLNIPFYLKNYLRLVTRGKDTL